ncbi:MAG: DUF4910 domain-containing protein [Verrucomicrobiota bacterium]
MNSDKLQIMRETFNSAEAIDYAAHLNRTDSQFTFSAFHKTSKTAAALMNKCGLEDVQIYSFPADGRTKYGDWVVPRAWDIKDAKLWIDTGKQFRKVADRTKVFCNSMMYSAPTPEGRKVECCLVSEHNRKAWKGNLVFTDNPGNVKPATLARHGALGIVTDFMPEWEHCRKREDVYDTVLWQNAYLAPANEHNLVGFQLSPREGDLIRKSFKKGTEKLSAKALVNSKLYDGKLDFVTGVIPGSEYPDQEVAVFAHLFEPGANDNASGCAMGLEALKTIAELQRKGKIKAPKRSIRLCYTFEIFGTLAFFEAYPEKMEKIMAGINPDMVAPDMEKCRSRLHVHGTPDSACSYVDALISNHIAHTFSHNYMLRWNERPFFINDNFVTDPSIGIPSPALVCLRDRYYHSSGDVPENLSPHTMLAIGSAMTAFLHDIASGEYETAVKLADQIMTREIQAIDKSLAIESGIPGKKLIAYRAERGKARLQTLLDFLAESGKKAALSKYIDKAGNTLDAFASARIQMTQKTKSADEWRALLNPPAECRKKARSMWPHKSVLGTVSRVHLTDKEKIGSEWSYRYNAPLFWADGSRSVYEIWSNSVLEFQRQYTLENMIRYFEELEQNGHAVIEKNRHRQQ